MPNPPLNPSRIPPRIAVIGLGPIGRAVATAVAGDATLRLTGLIDIDPALRGQRIEGIAVTDSLDAVEADVAIVTTSSQFDRIAPTLRACIARGWHVVSSCEQMLWPWLRHPALASELDELAQRAGVALLGTGVNPGFSLDTLPVLVASVIPWVSRVTCERRVDAAKRREPLQRKVGAGLSVAAFHATPGLGHQGLPESMCLLQAGLGAEPTGPEHETLEPVIAEREVACFMGKLSPGVVAGVHHHASWAREGLTLELDLVMAVGVTDEVDRVTLRGDRTWVFEAPSGIPGDIATVAILVNAARSLGRARPGLRTMLDGPLPGSRARTTPHG